MHGHVHAQCESMHDHPHKYKHTSCIILDLYYKSQVCCYDNMACAHKTFFVIHMNLKDIYNNKNAPTADRTHNFSLAELLRLI